MRGLGRRSKRFALALALLSTPAQASTLSEALAVGDCDIAALQTPGTDGERLGVARCLAAQGQANDALRLLALVEGGPLSSYAKLVRGEALLAQGDAGGAADALAGAQLSGDAGQRAAQLRGRALVEAGRYDEAREVLRPLLDGSLGGAGQLANPWGADPAEVRWWLAEGAARRGDVDRAVPVWQAIWSRNPTSPRAEQAAKRLSDAGRPVPDTTSDGGRALALERVKTLEKLQSYKEALALRDQLGAAPDRTQARAAFQAKDYARAAAAFSRLSDRSAAEQFDYALATSRAGDYARAATLYQELYTRFPATEQGDFASFKVAYLAYDATELDRAIGLFRDHLARYPSTTHGDEARWFIAWSLVRLGRNTDARIALDDVARRYPGSSLGLAARYWSARLAGRAGDPSAERSGLEGLISAAPTSGYAWFASARLNRTWPAPPEVALPAVPSALRTPAVVRGLLLAEAGMDGWASTELETAVSAARAAGKDAALALAHALIAVGSYPEAQALAKPWCGAPGRGGDAVANQACWPRPEASLVLRLAREGGLNPNLPFGIMNAESGLKPWVTSPAGARGLMQLMPEVGGRAHQTRFPGRAYDPDELYLPAYNAAIGVTTLSELQSRFANAKSSPSLPLVIAGYNGGAEAVERWLAADAGTVDGDWFAENISFTETRQYVRRVLGFVQTYRLIYGG